MREPNTDIADCDLVEGLLYKYTNVVKGFQYRWFILDPSRGTLEYFMVSPAMLQPESDSQEKRRNGKIVTTDCPFLFPPFRFLL